MGMGAGVVDGVISCTRGSAEGDEDGGLLGEAETADGDDAGLPIFVVGECVGFWTIGVCWRCCDG